MKILHTTAEFFPYIKAGGLSDMLSSLSEYQSRENEIFVALPIIGKMNQEPNFTGKEFDCIDESVAYHSDACKTDFENGNAKYVPYKNIFGNIEVNFNCLDSVKVADAENQNAIKYGDILFTGSSETAQEVGMSSSVTTKYEESIYLNSFSFGIRFNEEIKLMPEFSKYLFRCDFMRDEIAKTASGVTRFNISKTRFKKILIPIPCPENPKKSLEIQTEIVRILDNFTELTAKLTAELTAELTARKKQYKYYRDQLILNSGAKSEKLEQISEIYLGLTYTPTYTDKGVKFISARNTSSDFLDLTNVKYISEEEYKKSTLNASLCVCNENWL